MPKPASDTPKVLAVLLLLATLVAALADPPLTTADVVRLLEAKASDHKITSELQQRGFWAPLDETSETFLRFSGASDVVISAIRRAAPSPSPSPGTAGTPIPAIAAEAQGPTFAAAALTVRVPVSVLDKSGRPVMGLIGANFKVSENEARQPITLFSNERHPMRIALALDVSESMENKIAQVEVALKHFTRILEPNDEILVLTFNQQVQVLQDFTSDRGRLEGVLTMLEPTGATALYDAAYAAIRRVSRGPAESKAVILVTDGVNTASTHTFEDLLALAQKSEVPVFSIGLDSGRPRPTRPPPGTGSSGSASGGGKPPGWPPRLNRTGFDAKPLQELADETGGRAEIIKELEHYTPGEELPGSAKLKQAVESIALTLRHRYLVGYEPSAGKPGWRKLKVEVDRPSDATTRARKGYFAEK